IQTRLVQVLDRTLPVITLAGTDPMTAERHTTHVEPGAAATDMCDGDLSGALEISGVVDANTVGNYTVTYKVKDGSNNEAIQTRLVQVLDRTLPVITLAGTDPLTVECHTAYVEPGAAATDMCDGDLSGALEISGVVDANTGGNRAEERR